MVCWRAGRSRAPPVSSATGGSSAPGARRGEQLHPRRGQLDGQRQAVQVATDRGDGPGVGLVQAKSRSDGSCPLDEEADRLALGDRLHRWMRIGRGNDSGSTGTSCSPRRWSGARLVASTCSAGQAASNRATRSARPPRRARSYRAAAASDGGAGGEPVPLRSRRRAAGGERARGPPWPAPPRRRPGARDRPRPRRRRSDRPLSGNGQRQARLADPTGTGQGQERHGLVHQEGAAGRTLGFPADQPGAGIGGVPDRSSAPVPPWALIRRPCWVRFWTRELALHNSGLPLLRQLERSGATFRCGERPC